HHDRLAGGEAMGVPTAPRPGDGVAGWAPREGAGKGRADGDQPFLHETGVDPLLPVGAGDGRARAVARQGAGRVVLVRHWLWAEVVQGQLARVAAVPDAVLGRVAVDDQGRVDVHRQGHARVVREVDAAVADEQGSTGVGGAGDDELAHLPAAG